MNHVIFYLNDCIDLWFNTLLVHHLYLKRIEGHFLMINYEKNSCKVFLFCINILPQVPTLARIVPHWLGSWTISLSEGF
jgi:hypothetical protein